MNKNYKLIFYSLDILFKLYGGFVGATLVVFFYNQGFNEISTNFILSSALITIFISEIPTGALSDIYGRRFSLLSSGIALILANILFLVGSNIYIFLLAQISVGIANAFFSGTLESWTLENMNLCANEIDELFITKNKLSNIFVISAGALGSLFSSIHPRSIFALSLISSVIYTVIIWFSVHNTNFSGKKAQSGFKNIISDGYKEIKNTISCSLKFIIRYKSARNIIIFNSALAFCFSSVFVFWQPIVFELTKNNGYKWLGLAWIFMQVAMLCGTMISNYVVRLCRNDRFLALYLSTFVMGIGLIYGVMKNDTISIFTAIISFEVCLGIITPLRESSLNLYITDNERRATILSFQSMFIYVFNYFSMIIMGFIASGVNSMFTWGISGVLLIILSIVYFLKKRDY